jgi:putative transposase
LTKYSIRGSKVLKIRNEWYIFITIEKQDEPILPSDNVLAVDLGCKNIAVTVSTVDTKPDFYGAELRGIRGFYFNLRRKLGEKKAYNKIKLLKNIEFLRVNHELHGISKAIVEEAKRTYAVIVLGKLKGIPKSIKGSRRKRRLINNFPYYRLVQYIKYKAAWRSIRALEITEADTSNTCFNCRTKDKKARKTQGLFQCGNCSIRTNPDYNGAMNILQRGVGILSTLGGFLTYPEPSVIIDRNKMITKEPQKLWEDVRPIPHEHISC